MLPTTRAPITRRDLAMALDLNNRQQKTYSIYSLDPQQFLSESIQLKRSPLTISIDESSIVAARQIAE
ncbi:hypothetical protein KC340_g49 [Hortaea werneckii]|nr:hypothetical protein KC340_g49 [Hortaea werneckii]